MKMVQFNKNIILFSEVMHKNQIFEYHVKWNSFEEILGLGNHVWYTQIWTITKNDFISATIFKMNWQICNVTSDIM